MAPPEKDQNWPERIEHIYYVWLWTFWIALLFGSNIIRHLLMRAVPYALFPPSPTVNRSADLLILAHSAVLPSVLAGILILWVLTLWKIRLRLRMGIGGAKQSFLREIWREKFAIALPCVLVLYCYYPHINAYLVFKFGDSLFEFGRYIMMFLLSLCALSIPLVLIKVRQEMQNLSNATEQSLRPEIERIKREASNRSVPQNSRDE